MVSITIRQFGKTAFKRAVHSMPDMRTMKMSMRMMSGRAGGTIRTASSPEAQVQTHENSGKEPIRCDQLSRISRWSSTSATRTGGFDIFIAGKSLVFIISLKNLTSVVQVYPTNRDGTIGSAVANGVKGRCFLQSKRSL